jgi:HlyD family secretion protein
MMFKSCVRVLLVLPITLMLASCGDQSANKFPGYMEADLVLVGSEQKGRVLTQLVEEGDRVAKDQPLFTLESEAQEAEVHAAQARVSEAEARLADVRQTMQRPGEIEVLDASLKQTRAMLQNSKFTLERTEKLFKEGWASKAALDQAQAINDRDEAAVAEAEKRIGAAKLPGRSDMIDAATANAEAAKHALAEAETNIAKRSVSSPAEGTIEEVYFRPGEVVKEGQAVLALLPPGNLKVHFFVQEPVRATLSIDQTVNVSCDGCAEGLTAKISFIARDAEFTPPVIFSEEQRQKLVFLVEARPSKDTGKLTAGQPVTVTLGAQPQMVRQ